MRVSVCLASFNGINFIREQVSSILSQLSSDDELIVSDNGSTDGTMEFLTQISDPRVVVVVCSRRGVTANFQNAMLVAKGRYVFLSDQDDVWLPGRLAKALLQLERGFDLVAVGMTVIDSHGRPQKHGLYPTGGLVSNVVKNTYSGCCLAMSREFMEEVLPFPSHIPMHDWWIALVGLSLGSVCVVPEPLILYRRHGSNASATTEGSGSRIYTKVLYRLIIVSALLRFWINHLMKIR